MKKNICKTDVSQTDITIITDRFIIPLTGITVGGTLLLLFDYIFSETDSLLIEATVCCVLCIILLCIYFIKNCNILPWYVRFGSDRFTIKYFTGKKNVIKYENLKNLRLAKDFSETRSKDVDSAAKWTVIINTFSGGIFEIPKQREKKMWDILLLLRNNAKRYNIKLNPICSKESVVIAEYAEKKAEDFIQHLTPAATDFTDTVQAFDTFETTFSFNPQNDYKKQLLLINKGIMEKCSIGSNVVFANHKLIINNDEFKTYNVDAILLTVSNKDHIFVGRQFYEMRIKYNDFNSTSLYLLEFDSENSEEFATAFLTWCHMNNIIGIIY